MRNFNITALDTLSVRSLAELPPDDLVALQQESADSLALARKRCAHIAEAIDEKYRDAAQAARHAAKKDTGIVRFTDGDYTIVAETKKSVHWQQNQLAALRDRIAAEGDNPATYIVTETKLTVREAAYKDWPEEVRRAFEPCRTVMAGKPSYRIEPRKAEAA